MTIKNGDMPVSPLSGDAYQDYAGYDGTEKTSYNPQCQGLTKREHFAAMAPECPDWFSVKCKASISSLTEQEFADSREYSKGNYGYERFNEGSVANSKYNIEVYEAELAHKSERFFKWRIHYAESMLKALEEQSND